MATRYLPFHVPDLGHEEERSVVETLRSGWLTTGPKVKKFEERFAAAVGAKHAVAVNSGTAALHLALEAAGVKAGDEVVVPTMTFAATAEVVLYLGAKPVLADCRPDTLNLDPDSFAKAVTRRTKAVIPVHFGGLPCEMDRILRIARRSKLAVIEDAAHTFPASYRGKPVGSIGDVTCFSFYATKTITTGEGGMATTQDAALAERMRLMSLHGISKDAWKRYTANGTWRYDIVAPGYKYNLTDIAAALGLEQLKKAERMRRVRERYAKAYDAAFAGLPLELPARPDRGSVHAWHLYPLRLDLPRLRLSRDAFIDRLKELGIGTSVHFIPLHLHPFYRKTFGYKPQDFPNAAAAFERSVSLPLYSKMTEADVRRVAGAVTHILRENLR